ncbi:hypothetical protein RS694_14730 [Rhodoferax saidenbachensis]|uniref:Solute-binding protein family 3/N-terminal domain-containing protein n=2 Tax=Rhodoferax saidenbachensis TaxID=1484693 RepID=A0A1P8KCC2_9BURK|nr:hypothetical protein RS694_14730 [Rhodoferax saidenbachensis]
MPLRRCCCVGLLLLLLWATGCAMAAAPMVFIYKLPPSEMKSTVAKQYTRTVLRMALERTTREFGPFELHMAINEMNETRQVVEMEKGGGLVNTVSLPARKDLDKRLVAVRIPKDFGVLGFRVFLIRAEDQPRFDAIRTVADLQAIRIGQGTTWVDGKILEDAGLQVVRGSDFEGLFQMLQEKRFDAFSRGVYEAGRELEARQASLVDLAIEKGLLLYYPMPGYYWFPNTPDGKLRARRVEAGLTAMVADGTLKRLFLQEYGLVLKQLDLSRRRLLKIDNSQLGPDEPLDNPAFWLNPAELGRK